jgi:hypothetical protein
MKIVNKLYCRRNFPEISSNVAEIEIYYIASGNFNGHLDKRKTSNHSAMSQRN